LPEEDEESPVNAPPPLVSVIIPNYNYATTLAHCVRAALAQTYPAVEVVVADDCSVDDSVAVARSLGATVVSTGVNGGVSVARNLGARNASGGILFFCDSDVALAPDAVANAVALLTAREELGAVCGVYEPTPMIRDSLIKEYRCLHHSFWMAASDGPIATMHTAMCALRAEVFADVGPFDETLRHSEDGDYGNRICRRYTVVSTTTVHGRHDHDGTLGLVLRKVFQRTRMHIPLFFRQRGLRGEFANPTRASGSVAALLTALTLPLAVFGAALLAVPAVLFVLSLIPDLDIYRYVHRQRGARFLAFFVAVNFVVNLGIATGAGTGLLQWLLVPAFRRTYGLQVTAPRQVTDNAA
jgi:glycosyl transferase family 2